MVSFTANVTVSRPQPRVSGVPQPARIVARGVPVDIQPMSAEEVTRDLLPISSNEPTLLYSWYAVYTVGPKPDIRRADILTDPASNNPLTSQPYQYRVYGWQDWIDYLLLQCQRLDSAPTTG